MMAETLLSGRIFELSSERHITGRRKIKLILHEIFPSHDIWQSNGISWDEAYTAQNLGSVVNMSICAEFLDNARSLPYGHGLTDVRDNIPLLEDATVVGHCEKAYIDDIEIDGTVKRVLIADGYIDEMRYPKFVAWLSENLSDGSVKGSVEIVGHPEHDNHIIYDGGWKETGRVPQIYDYSGYAVLGIKPADDTAIVIELNQNQNHEEDNRMDEKMKKELGTLVSGAIAELNSKWDEYYAKVQLKDAEITQLKADIAQKEAEIAQLRADYETANAAKAAAELGIAEANTKISALEKEKKLAELDAALAGFTAEEQAVAQAEIDAFRADPTSVSLDSIAGKICVALVRKAKENPTHEQNSAGYPPDIFSGVSDIKGNDDSDIYGA